MKRKIEIELDDVECRKFINLCNRGAITPSELIQQFVHDLIGGRYSNGSDEQDLAGAWYNRCGFDYCAEESLINWLYYEEDDCVEEFLLLPDWIESAYEDLKMIEKNPENFPSDAKDETLQEIEDFQQKIDDFKRRYLEAYPTHDWEKELAGVKRWYRHIDNFKECCEVPDDYDEYEEPEVQS